ncbi:creatininase family protein [Leucobacter sp. wl10]|uniref:creatininase family protein n=1 Tax=Leucobacter sp. wl10 TaxID=2304677 RepID=UPI001968D6B5|nr:creatininase family protein [Leucobacter sp. wl10]
MGHFRTHRLGELSWTEARDAAAQSPIVLIPSGAIEQHGAHLPLNEDAITAEWVAEYIAEHLETPVLVAPTLSYGHSPIFAGFAGTLNLSFETLQAVLFEVMDSLVQHGFRRIVIVNNNGGNQAPAEHAADRLRRKHGVLVGSVYPWGIGYRVMRDLYDDPAIAYGHGSEPEHSAMLAMFPELVQSQFVADGGLVPFEGWTPTNYSEGAIPGTAESGTLYWDFSDVSPSGVTGDPRLGSAEIGADWIKRVAHDVCLGFVREFERNTVGADWAKA